MRQYFGERLSKVLLNGISIKANNSFQSRSTSNFQKIMKINPNSNQLNSYSSLISINNIFNNIFSGIFSRGISTTNIILQKRSLNYFQKQTNYQSTSTSSPSSFSFGNLTNLISNNLFNLIGKRYFAKRVKFGQEINPKGVTLWQDQPTRSRWMLLSTFFSGSLLFSFSSWSYIMFTMQSSPTELAPKKQRYGLGFTMLGMGVFLSAFFLFWRRTAVSRIVLFPNNRVQ